MRVMLSFPRESCTTDLGVIVEGAGRLVEQQDAGLAGQRAGDQQPLPLPSGQPAHAFVRHRLQPLRHRPDVPFEAAGAERFPDLVGVEPGRAGDVVADAVGRHLTVLQNDAQMTADRLWIEVEEIVAVEQHRPRVRPLEAEQQPVMVDFPEPEGRTRAT